MLPTIVLPGGGCLIEADVVRGDGVRQLPVVQTLAEVLLPSATVFFLLLWQ
jgi:hypothetical protein